MKTNDLRTTLLILGGTLMVAFVLSVWWVSRQARSLREIQAETAAAKEDLAVAKNDLAHVIPQLIAVRSDIESLRAFAKTTERQMNSQPAKYPVLVIRSAKHGFNDIQHHVAKGEFAGLALTDGYVELKEIFDNPALEEMLASDHGPMARE